MLRSLLPAALAATTFPGSAMLFRTLLLAAAVLGAGCVPGRAAAPPEPACRPGVGPPRPPPPASIAAEQTIHVCVLRGGRLENVAIGYNVTTGDSTYQGRPFPEAFPADSPYAANARWFIDGEMITWQGRRLGKNGLPREIEARRLEPAGEHRGVPLFTETGAAAPGTLVLYAPVRPGCVFQPYQVDYVTGAVRGAR